LYNIDIANTGKGVRNLIRDLSNVLFTCPAVGFLLAHMAAFSNQSFTLVEMTESMRPAPGSCSFPEISLGISGEAGRGSAIIGGKHPPQVRVTIPFFPRILGSLGFLTLRFENLS
jgi:hypothetical protein